MNYYDKVNDKYDYDSITNRIKQILYLNMNDVNEGQKVFRCSTTFDYYILLFN